MDVQNQWAATTLLPESSENQGFKVKSTGLAIFGSLQIAMGGLSALLVPLMLFSIAIGQPSGGATTAQILPAACLYAMLAIALVTLGIGSILARRWARALTLVLAWMWLIMGVISMISMLFVMPGMMAAQQPQAPPLTMKFIYTMMIIMMAGIYIVLPGIFVLFYKRSDVKATCQWRDPKVRWTDKCPLPVLSLSLLLGFGATSFIWSASYGFVTPFFGMFLKGVPGAILVLSVSLLFGYLAWATYKLKIAAWWATLCFFILFGLSATISFLTNDVIDLYREMDFPPDQLEMMEKSGAFEMNMPLLMGINTVVFIGYLIWVRRYFRVPSDSETTTPQVDLVAE